MPVTRSPRGGRPAIEGPGFLARADLQFLFDLLREDGRRLIGPTVADGSIIYDDITSVDELPRGWGDEQAPGRYRLRRRGDERLFGYVVGPTAWKKWTFPALIPLTNSTRDGHKVSFQPEQVIPPKLAFLGVRACEIAALAVQDRVLMGTEFIDPDYMVRRANVFVVAVQCTTSASTCFCTSMGTGPEVTEGFDLSLTELDAGFLVDAGTPPGARSWSACRSARRAPPSSTAWPPRSPLFAPGSATPSRPRASTTASWPSWTIRAGPRSPSAASRAATARWPARRASARRSRR